MADTRKSWGMLSALVPVIAILAITGAGLGSDGRPLYLVCKPLATILLLTLAWRAPQPVSARYRWAIVVGLVWSLIGDVLLMFAGYFVFGLVAFLIAHLAYIYAFTDGVRLFARPLTSIAGLILAAVIVCLLWPGVPAALRIPVIAYAIALATMATQAITRVQVLAAVDGLAANSARLAAIGACLFMVSDTVLSYGRFRDELPFAAVLVLSTYYIAQWFIARSVSRAAWQPVGVFS